MKEIEIESRKYMESLHLNEGSIILCADSFGYKHLCCIIDFSFNEKENILYVECRNIQNNIFCMFRIDRIILININASILKSLTLQSEYEPGVGVFYYDKNIEIIFKRPQNDIPYYVIRMIGSKDIVYPTLNDVMYVYKNKSGVDINIDTDTLIKELKSKKILSKKYDQSDLENTSRKKYIENSFYQYRKDINDQAIRICRFICYDGKSHGLFSLYGKTEKLNFENIREIPIHNYLRVDSDPISTVFDKDYVINSYFDGEKHESIFIGLTKNIILNLKTFSDYISMLHIFSSHDKIDFDKLKNIIKQNM